MSKRPDLREFVLVKNTMTTIDNSEEPKPKQAKEPGDNDGYFSSYNDIEVHKLMLQDKPRTEAYQRAILDNQEFFKGKTVLDIGAGTGILSLFSLKAGAAKVYAVEASPMVETLREIVKLNDENGLIEVVYGKAEDIDLPVKVDIIISEWMGFYLLHESMLDSVIKARDKHLQDDGLMFPSHASLYGAPVELNSYMNDNISFWESVYGFNMNPVAQKVLENKISGGQPEIMIVEKSQLLSEPCLITEYDLRWVQLDEVQAVQDRKFISISRSGNYHGMVLWFRTDFKPVFYDSELTDAFKSVSLDTAPGSPDTHWKQTVIVIPRTDSEVEIDEVVGWELNMEQSKENPRHYQLGISILDPTADEHPMPCACKMARCALFAALMEKEDEDLEELGQVKSNGDIEHL